MAVIACPVHGVQQTRTAHDGSQRCKGELSESRRKQIADVLYKGDMKKVPYYAKCKATKND